jgi:hypothetical protein
MNVLDLVNVYVYWNLHRHCWSVKKKGIVVAHCDSLLLKNVTFKVSEPGRQRVIKEKRKNVHAYANGDVVLINEPKPFYFDCKITYNPYFYDSFVFYENVNRKILSAPFVYCGNKQLFIEDIIAT